MMRLDYRGIAEYEREWTLRNPDADAIKKAEESEKRRWVTLR